MKVMDGLRVDSLIKTFKNVIKALMCLIPWASQQMVKKQVPHANIDLSKMTKSQKAFMVTL